ncbi:MAG: methylated-DNA--[protein]-cysteine S-methyltransferase [Deltaproteobacteria bacterium]|nr:methylated-DNA--[protein]-cysteine S-methyltransferase [Deltaproteobacteria bacterium]
MLMHVLSHSGVETVGIQTVLGVFQVAATAKGICSLRFPDVDARVIKTANNVPPAKAGVQGASVSQQDADSRLRGNFRVASSIKNTEKTNADYNLSFEHIRQAQVWLTAYLDRQPMPPMPLIDFHWCTDFGRAVYTALMQVPPGNVITYGALAGEIGHPGSARAVGGWMRKNQIPVLIPCHRVVQSGGAVGGWSGPDGMKERLLKHESYLSRPLGR